MSQLKAFPSCRPILAEQDWECGPVGVTQISMVLERANYDAAITRLAQVDPDYQDWECIRWDHFGVGWVEEIFTAPNTEANRAARRMKNDLEYYPCLDDNLLGEYQEAEEQEALAAKATRDHKPITVISEPEMLPTQDTGGECGDS